ncbi:MAG: response regulator transcription factor [Akkermansiaceae bacterium]|nr:response regulator transcription factor [Verrucomicrobiales bacterium]
MKPITVLISDDHQVVREGLRLLLQASQEILVVGEAENGVEAVTETRRLQPEVVLLDLAMPMASGVEATRLILKSAPATRVLILSSYSDDLHVQQAIAAGAAGYIMKAASADDLLGAIREVYAGNAYFSPPIAKGLLGNWRDKNSPLPPVEPARLTPRESETLRLIAGGFSTKQIATLLSIKEKTAEKHRQALMNKLDIHKVAVLTRYAVANGVVESGGMW